jgi:hypothetical protein
MLLRVETCVEGRYEFETPLAERAETKIIKFTHEWHDEQVRHCLGVTSYLVIKFQMRLLLKVLLYFSNLSTNISSYSSI